MTKLGVPLLSSMLQNAEDIEAARLFLTQYQFSSPYLLPPGTDPARVEILRSAFEKTLSDPEFLKDAEKSGVEVNLMTGRDMQAAVDALYQARPDVIARVRQAMTRGAP